MLVGEMLLALAVMSSSFLRFFFFFQAEDCIRDFPVTGVQACALPISWRSSRWRAPSGASSTPASPPITPTRRSEERRVGKECRSRGSPSHYYKKTRELGGDIRCQPLSAHRSTYRLCCGSG